LRMDLCSSIVRITALSFAGLLRIVMDADIAEIQTYALCFLEQRKKSSAGVWLPI